MNPILINPKIDRNANSDTQIQQMRSYLFQFKEQIELILSNIDRDNFSKETNSLFDDVEENRKVSEVTMGNLSSKITQTASQIESVVTGLNGANSRITQNANAIALKADRIELNGLVSFSDLSTSGKTTINGANITTGTISADRLDVANIVTKGLDARDIEIGEGGVSCIRVTVSELQVGNNMAGWKTITVDGTSYTVLCAK